MPTSDIMLTTEFTAAFLISTADDTASGFSEINFIAQ